MDKSRLLNEDNATMIAMNEPSKYNHSNLTITWLNRRKCLTLVVVALLMALTILLLLYLSDYFAEQPVFILFDQEELLSEMHSEQDS